MGDKRLIDEPCLFKAYYFRIYDGGKFSLKFAMPDRDSHQSLMQRAWEYASTQYDESEALLFGLRYIGMVEYVDIVQQ